MSESRTFVFPENGNSGGGTNGILAMLPALMQQRGVDSEHPGADGKRQQP